jgi:hypothetical protein
MYLDFNRILVFVIGVLPFSLVLSEQQRFNKLKMDSLVSALETHDLAMGALYNKAWGYRSIK